MRKFFSIDGNFNIFILMGLILVGIGLVYKIHLIMFIGLEIEFIPQTVKSIKEYKETKNINYGCLLYNLMFIAMLMGSLMFVLWG